MSIATPTELQGVEVLLRPMSIADAEAFAAAAAESREHYHFNPVPDGLDDARRYIERAFRQRDDGRRMPFTVVWRNRVVGSTSYSEFQPWEWPAASLMQRLNQPDAVEVGYTWLAASAQLTRCNTEAKWLLFTHAFDGWNVYRVCLRTDERNARSRRAIERLGARFEGIRRADMPGQDGTVRNSAFYSIVRDEWPEVQKRLRGLLAR
jgi:RimJ/RimL family protein N-acetyltransferase